MEERAKAVGKPNFFHYIGPLWVDLCSSEPDCLLL